MSLRLLTVSAVSAALFSFAAAAQAGQVEVKEAWARATPAKAENGAAYMTLVSPVPDRLVAASTPVAKKAELHLMSMEGGVMKMRQVSGVALPAGEPVVLKPGGYHIMLLGLTRQLEQGQTFPLTLTFENGGTQTVTATIEKIGSMGPHAVGSTGPGSMPMNRH
jgi:copper(I)-binding protein